jgi:S-formylglutathione hydrolase
MKYLVLYFLTSLMLIFQSNAQEGKIITVSMHAVSLEENLVGDSPDRKVSIYLPPGYDTNPDMSYPTIYLLHGFSGRKTGANDWSWAFSAADINDLISSGTVSPVIIVMPDACNQFGGSMYTNSVTTGFWEDFITRDLIEFVETNYRSISDPERRGITGFSMGGYGAIKIAMKHPDLYRAVYANSSCCLDHTPGNFNKKLVMEAMAHQNLETITTETSFSTKTYLASSAAFSPNPDNPPFYADFPFGFAGDSLSINESATAQWLANYPSWMADQYVTNLRELHAIAFDAGTKETGILKTSQHFSSILKRMHVEHSFEEFDGGHGDKFGERLKTRMLPFFSAEFTD